VAAAARGAAGGVERGGCAGLVEGGGGRHPHPGAQGRPKTGPSPVDRARTGSKHHLITEAHGIPLAVTLPGGNRNDVTQLMPLIEAVPPVRGRPDVPADGRTRSTPTVGTTTTPIAARSARRGSLRSSHDAAPSTAPAWACIAGSWSRPSRSCTGFVGYGSAGRSATTSTRPSSPPPAPSSAGVDSSGLDSRRSGHLLWSPRPPCAIVDSVTD